jgi:annulin
MSTKAVGSSDRIDVTSEYKFKESTPEEREVMLKALKTCKNIFSRYYLNAKFNEIRFDLILIDDIVIGESFRVS